jgi:hypothetical protein
MAYGDEKDYGGRKYRGMKVGGVHRWTYPDGQWTERKVSPQRWEIGFTSLKRRRTRAPDKSGAEVGSGYHWFIVAHQWAGKLDANTYATQMEGTKHLIAFRKPGWRGWTTQQRGHTSARLRTIMALEEILAELREAQDGEFEDPQDAGALGTLVTPGGEAKEPKGFAPPGTKEEEGVAAIAKAPRRATSRPRRVRNGSRSPRRRGAATPTPRQRRR